MKALVAATAILIGLWVAVPVSAHHSMAGFDRTQRVTFEGTITEFKWANPHSWIELEVEDPNGPVLWNFEMTAPAYLARAGWKRTSLKPGDKVSIVGSPLINGDPGALFVSVTLADGSILGERPGAGKGKGKGK